jgi:hypothetical protein
MGVCVLDKYILAVHTHEAARSVCFPTGQSRRRYAVFVQRHTKTTQARLRGSSYPQACSSRPLPCAWLPLGAPPAGDAHVVMHTRTMTVLVDGTGLSTLLRSIRMPPETTSSLFSSGAQAVECSMAIKSRQVHDRCTLLKRLLHTRAGHAQHPVPVSAAALSQECHSQPTSPPRTLQFSC